jgi:hypothetical protein
MDLERICKEFQADITRQAFPLSAPYALRVEMVDRKILVHVGNDTKTIALQDIERLQTYLPERVNGMPVQLIYQGMIVTV